MAVAVMTGFFSHLLLDEICSVDLKGAPGQQGVRDRDQVLGTLTLGYDQACTPCSATSPGGSSRSGPTALILTPPIPPRGSPLPSAREPLGAQSYLAVPARTGRLLFAAGDGDVDFLGRFARRGFGKIRIILKFGRSTTGPSCQKRCVFNTVRRRLRCERLFDPVGSP